MQQDDRILGRRLTVPVYVLSFFLTFCYFVCLTQYADDTTLICTSREELLDMLRRTKQASYEKNLLLNTQKTKILVIDRNRRNFNDFILDGDKIAEVQDFIYLGSLVSAKGSSEKEIKRIIAIARNATQKMVKIWRSRGINNSLKLQIALTSIFPIATYGSETWAMTKRDEKRVDAFEMWVYRRILRVPWTDRRTNRWVLDKLDTEMLLRKSIARRKLQFFGHVVRRDGLGKSLITGTMEARRRRGRPAISWFKDIHIMDRATRATADREGWRRLVMATAAQLAPPD